MVLVLKCVLALMGCVRKMEVMKEMIIDVIHFLHSVSPSCTA